MVLKAYEYRIYPNETQRELIEKTFGVCRLVYSAPLKYRTYQNYSKDRLLICLGRCSGASAIAPAIIIKIENEAKADGIGQRIPGDTIA